MVSPSLGARARVVRKVAVLSEVRVMVASESVEPAGPVNAARSWITAPSGRVMLATDSEISKFQ